MRDVRTFFSIYPLLVVYAIGSRQLANPDILVTICLVIFETHMNILVITQVKIHVLVK